MTDEAFIGQRFGMWEVVSKHGTKGHFLCRCDCGVSRRIRRADLTRGKTRMCRQCSVSVTNQTHGMHESPEYSSWSHMIQRCHNPNSKDYVNYGGRGIEVHQLWRDSFEAFFMYLGPKPTADYTIERIDTNGNYAPGNVRWATRAEQTLNQRSNVWLEIDGETKAVSEWSRDPRCPVSQFTIHKRLSRGWEARRAVFEPSQVHDD